VFLVNSRLNLFTAAPSGSTRKALHLTRASLLPKLRDDFAEFLNDGYLDHLSIFYLSTCVGFGTGTLDLPRGFSRRLGVRDSPPTRQLHSRLGYRATAFHWKLPYTLSAGRPSPATPNLPRPPIGQMIRTWYGNINPLAIDYAFRPRLRSRLTLSRRTLLRKPWTIGGGDSHPSFVTHAGILTSQASTAGFRRRFTGKGTLSYRVACATPVASVACLSPVELSAHDHLTSELLRTLSRMAASKPTSWLSVQSHIVSHLACT
jgi:hypothetical protein